MLLVTAVHNCESVDGGGFCARIYLSILLHTCSIGFMSMYLGDQIISWNCPVFLKPIANDLGPLTWRIVILENYVVDSVKEANEWLQMVSQ